MAQVVEVIAAFLALFMGLILWGTKGGSAAGGFGH